MGATVSDNPSAISASDVCAVGRGGQALSGIRRSHQIPWPANIVLSQSSGPAHGPPRYEALMPGALVVKCKWALQLTAVICKRFVIVSAICT